MAGYKANTKIWLHKGKERRLQRRLVPNESIKDNLVIAGLLLLNWHRGMGVKGKLNRPQQKQVINHKTQETQWIPKSEVKEYLILNPLWSLGSGQSYNRNNKGNTRGNYSQKRRGYHFKAPRDWAIGSTRMYLPSDPDTQGKYIPKDQVDYYLSLDWVKGIRYTKDKVTCELCSASLTPQQLTHHPNQLCRQTEKKDLLKLMFESQNSFSTPTGYSKSFLIKEHPLYPQYRELVDLLRA